MLDRLAFADPPARFRPSPFWVFNADPTDAELRARAADLQARGFGGFFIHPRVGLETPYLREPWFRQVGVCVAAARARGMECWLYDEDRWPSGFAGGRLLDAHPQFRSRDLLWGEGADAAEARRAAEARVRILEDDGTGRARGTFRPFREFAVRGPAARPAWRPLRAGAGLRRGERVLAFVEHEDGDANWYGGHTYVDLMNPAAVKAFLDLTYEAYARRFGAAFGRTIPGIFTDEPMMRNWASTSLPWTAGFDRVLARALPGGLDALPAVVLPGPAAPAVRHAFLGAATDRFVASFTRQVARWCARHRLLMTGHWLAEDQLVWQASQIGAAMPHYAEEQVPGIDHLLRQADQRLTHKQVASVARQLDRRRVLSEIFGVSGHTLSFEDQKWIGDWHLVNGVNFFCHHLVLPTMAGDRKRDYPPTFSPHQPSWPDFKAVNDYFGRVGYAVSQGRAVADVLVLHPIRSVWAGQDWTGHEPEAVNRFDRGLTRVMDALAAVHRDFDLGDETILRRAGRVAGAALRVAKAGRYRVVVVPPSTNWEAATVRVLERYAAAGGRLVFCGERPKLIAGRPAAARWRRLAARAARLSGPAGLAAAVGPSRDFAARVNGRRRDGELAYQHRVEGGRHLYFVINRSRTESKRCVLTLAGRGGVRHWDAVTGRDALLPSFPAALEGVPARAVAVTLPPVGSALLTVGPETGPGRRSARPARETRLPLGALETVTPDEDNVLVLDRCRFTVNGTGDGREHPVHAARTAAFEAAGLKQFAGLQPWRTAEKGIRPSRTARIGLTFAFRVADVPPAGVSVVVETPGAFAIALNGRPVPAARGTPWRGDRRLVRLRLPRVRRGMNTLALTGDYGLAMEIEDLFLLGRFNVTGPATGPFTIRPYRPPSRLGAWTAQGFPFYIGNMTYRFTARVPRAGRYRLRLGRASATLYRVAVDGRPRGRILWAPWEADLGRLAAGRHRLAVTAVSSLQNAFGPLHNTQYRTKGYTWWIGPDAFTGPTSATRRYHAHPYGLGQPPVLIG